MVGKYVIARFLVLLISNARDKLHLKYLKDEKYEKLSY